MARVCKGFPLSVGVDRRRARATVVVRRRAPYVLGQSFGFDRGFRPRKGAGAAKPGFAVGFARASAVRRTSSAKASALTEAFARARA